MTADTPRRWQAGTTVAVVALAVLSSLLGLLRPGHYVDAAALVELYRIQDATILLVGVPTVALGLLYAARGSLRGRVVWLGGLAYMTYTWATVVLQVSFNVFFLGYVVLFSLSLFTLVGALLTTDPAAYREALEGRIPTPVYGGALVVLALGLAALWLSDIVPALLAGTDTLLVEEAGPQALVSHVVDLAVVVPSLLLTAVWLLRGRAWGYVLAGILLVVGATLGASISAMTLVNLWGGPLSVSPVAALLSFAPVAIAAVLAFAYLWSIDQRD